MRVSDKLVLKDLWTDSGLCHNQRWMTSLRDWDINRSISMLMGESWGRDVHMRRMMTDEMVADEQRRGDGPVYCFLIKLFISLWLCLRTVRARTRRRFATERPAGKNTVARKRLYSGVTP
jgi:hypothetical protein